MWIQLGKLKGSGWVEDVDDGKRTTLTNYMQNTIMNNYRIGINRARNTFAADQIH